ncbi:MAG: hypothetical protein ACHP7P_09655 [Terriglobales bacterium]
MTLFWSKAAVIATSLLFLPACSAAQTMAAPKPGAPTAPPANKVATVKQRKHATSKPSPEPLPQTLPPPAPLTPEQMPAQPPQVTYNNGLLSIVATNSTLSDILHAVSTRTGATVDAPAQLTRERVAARIGPGTPREVLSDLLTGPRFDYILVGSDGDPNAVRSIILTANQSSPSAGAAMAQRPPVRAAMPPQVDADDEAEEEQASQPAAPPAQPPQQAPPGPRPFIPQQPPDQVGGQPPASGEGGQQVKSPEQLLEQLRRMQQPGNPPPDAR